MKKIAHFSNMLSAAVTETNLELTEFTFWETQTFSVFMNAVFTESQNHRIS